MTYSFPGNIREVENLITRLYIFSEEHAEIKSDLLPSRIKTNENGHSLRCRWQEIEKQHIQKVLLLFKCNQRQSALALGYAINTLKSKILKYGIQ